MVSCNITCRLRLKIRLWLLSYIIYQCIYQIIVLHCSPSRTGIFNPFINVHYDFICIVMDYFFDLNVTSNAIKNLSLVVSLSMSWCQSQWIWFSYFHLISVTRSILSYISPLFFFILSFYASILLGAYESIEDVMFKMRSQYGMNTDSMMWEIIIIESSKISSVMGTFAQGNPRVSPSVFVRYCLSSLTLILFSQIITYFARITTFQFWVITYPFSFIRPSVIIIYTTINSLMMIMSLFSSKIIMDQYRHK